MRAVLRAWQRMGLLMLLFLVACAPRGGAIPSSSPTAPLSPAILPTPSPTVTPAPPGLWIGPGVPEALREAALGWGIPVTEGPQSATLRLDVARQGEEAVSRWVYALVAPFPTVTDGVTWEDLRRAWAGEATGPFAGQPLLMDGVTLAALSAFWGEPAAGAVRVVEGERLVDVAWEGMPSWGIVPFERLEPRWKVLLVDGQSPIRKDFDPSVYPLTVPFALQPAGPSISHPVNLPVTNRDPSKLTTVVLTGVTALVRATAYVMEKKGVTYPGQDIADWLREADIAHISDEVSFFSQCPPPTPSRHKLIFCSDPRYIELFEYVGVDVIELSGDHLNDYGYQAVLETLDLLRKHGIAYYGGGENLQEGLKPLLLEHNGNKIAFIGCNAKLGDYAKATDTVPGAVPCRFSYMTETIRELRQQGYLVIVTFQHEECYSHGPCYRHEPDFHRVAEAGAVIVSGSQAHFPHVMEFYGDTFIHYGLGNLFFDQMGDIPPIPGIRREFLDRHIFYDGRYISTELLTAELIGYARPKPMTPQDRAAFLSEYFAASGWITPQPTLTPSPTLTLTPMTLPVPVYTLTPSP